MTTPFASLARKDSYRQDVGLRCNRRPARIAACGQGAMDGRSNFALATASGTLIFANRATRPGAWK